VETTNCCPALFERLSLWLNGSFNCRRCGRQLYIMSFGYGEAICPDCYRGEEPFIFPDKDYWLNRILARLMEPKTKQPEKDLDDQLLSDQAFIQQEVETAG